MPTVILEGMASGLGIIATDVGAVRALVSGDTGWLIQSGSVSALEQAISAAVDLPRELLFEKKRNALELVRRSYVWERVAEETAKNISNALASAS
jgi:glycosyltransferase involved in cell wall biosynthesis